jgi:hypothetical protein
VFSCDMVVHVVFSCDKAGFSQFGGGFGGGLGLLSNYAIAVAAAKLYDGVACFTS